jgi:branched-chain amino acid transport system permease protein
MTLKNSLTYFALILVCTLLPLVSGEYYVNLGSQIMIAAVFAASLNLLVGYGGLTSLGHATFLGLAAYVSAWLYLNMGMGHAYSAPVALGLTTLVGALFGWISLRASGLSFLMLTLALSQIVWGVGYRWVSLTNGDNGLSGLTRPMPFGWDLENSTNFYWFTLIVTIACLFFIGKIVNSPFGASLKGTRDQDKRMSALGYDVWKIRWITFVMSSFFGAISGLLYVYFNKYIHPSVISITSSAEALFCVIAGGSGTLAGPIIGSILIVLLKNYVSGFVERWNMLLGVIFVFIVIFMPAGLVPGIVQLKTRLLGDKK